MRYNEFLTEIRVVYKPKEFDGSYFLIAHRGKIWLFDESKPFPKETVSDMEKLFDYILSYEDSDTPVEDFRHSGIELEQRPDLVVGQLDLEDKSLVVNGFGTVQTPYSSRMIKDIVNYFKLDHVRVTSLDPTDERENEITVTPEEMKGGISDKLWHGTQLDRALGIIKTGIRPNQAGNWAFKVKNLIFLTSIPQNAIFHAINSSSEDNPPVVVLVKVPDKDQIVWDFDTAVRIYGALDPESKKLGYTDVAGEISYLSPDLEIIKNLNKGTDLNTPMGIFGYRGRIPASHIISIGAALQKGWRDEGTDYWSWFDSVQEFKDALEIYHELGEYYRGIEEQIEDWRGEEQ